MSFTVAVDQFEGPLDLMLHLIKEKELDLFDLDIHVLTEQYLLYLNKMEEMHLEVCSEYLVELATLIEYKSKKLCRSRKRNLTTPMRKIRRTVWSAGYWNINSSRKSASS